MLYVLGVSWTALANESGEDFSCLLLGLLLGGLWLLEGAPSGQSPSYFLRQDLTLKLELACCFV